ncbi:muellerian-inhibiting factor [Pelodytes ibericus]
MSMLNLFWWLVMLPLLCQTLPSKVGKQGEMWAEKERDLMLQVDKVLPKSGHQLAQDRKEDALHGTECGLKESGAFGTGWGNLETQGVLRDYDRGFLDAIKQSSWSAGDLEMFGMCPDEQQPATLVTMKHLSKVLADPQGKHLVILHLDKNEWELSASLQFKGTVQEHISPLLQHVHLLILVFYPDTRKYPASSHTSKVLVSLEGDPQDQVACMSLDTHYLVLKLKGTMKNFTFRNLQFHVSLHLKDHTDGLPISKTEVQRLLFGTDKCLTKMTPALFMVIGHLHVASSLSASDADLRSTGPSLQGGMANIPAFVKDEFLETLSHFSSKLLSSKGKASSTIHLSLNPTDDSVGDLRPQLFNITEMEALEWLVESQEPLVFLFLPGSKHLMWTKFQEKCNETMLEKITVKIQEVLEVLEEVLSDAEHIQILQRLLISCHGSFNVSYLPKVEMPPKLGENKHRKLHSLMLLKALQTVRAYWQDRKKLSRQNRGTGLKPHCRLQDLIINLKPYTEYKDILFPEEIHINNCVGPCRFPQTTQSDYQAHVILLIQLQEKMSSELARPPCCVPVKYEEQWLMVADENGLRLQLYPNMVAKECGCR